MEENWNCPAKAGKGGGEENRARVKGKMTPTLRNMEAEGRKRSDCNLKKPLLLVCTKLYRVGSPVMGRLANKQAPLLEVIK